MPKRQKSTREKQLTHLDETGAARMVDVGAKKITSRRAKAAAEVRLGPDAWRALTSGETPKGDAIAVARIAAIQAAKKTSELIPLCHPLPITKVNVEIRLDAENRVVMIEAEVQCDGKTGVEMEALTAVSVGALALYDMLKAVEKGIMIGPVRLLEKSGGRSGRWSREGSA